MTIAPNSGMENFDAKRQVKSDFPSTAQKVEILRIKFKAILETLIRS